MVGKVMRWLKQGVPRPHSTVVPAASGTHFLQDDAIEVVHLANVWLIEHFEKPSSVDQFSKRRLTAEQIEDWKRSLEANW